jgi:hypothetical protein
MFSFKARYLSRRDICGSAVGLAAGYGRGVGVRVVQGQELSPPLYRPDRLWGPLSLLPSGYRGVNRPGREVYHTPPISAEVTKASV